MKIQIAGKIEDSLTNGEGIRMVIFMSGCKHNCKNCQNKEMQNFKYGDEWEVDELFNYIKNNSILIDGITYSGGDPFEQAEALVYLSKRIKKELQLNIWCYTGYVLEDILKSSDIYKKDLLKYIDVLIDGKYEEEKKENALKYTGSSNQRILDIKKYI